MKNRLFEQILKESSNTKFADECKCIRERLSNSQLYPHV